MRAGLQVVDVHQVGAGTEVGVMAAELHGELAATVVDTHE